MVLKKFAISHTTIGQEDLHLNFIYGGSGLAAALEYFIGLEYYQASTPYENLRDLYVHMCNAHDVDFLLLEV